MAPSPALAEVIGRESLPRTEITKRLWAYALGKDCDFLIVRRIGSKNFINRSEIVSRCLSQWSENEIRYRLSQRRSVDGGSDGILYNRTRRNQPVEDWLQSCPFERNRRIWRWNIVWLGSG